MKGKCQGCGTIFHGWALRDSEKRICERCGGIIEIIESGSANSLSNVPNVPKVLKTNSPRKLGEGLDKST